MQHGKSRKTKMLAIGLMSAVMCGAPLSALAAKVVHFNMSGPLIERPMGDTGLSFGNQPLTLKSLLERFKKAGEDSEVRAILITFEGPAFGLAQAEEIRQAMQKVGKPVHVHADSLNTGLLALSTAASSISVTPTGDVWLTGFYSEAPYLKRLMEKIHVQPDFVHIGDFKSAGEMFYRDGPSKPAAENIDWLLDDLYESVVKMIADTRYGGNVEKVKKLIDNGPYTAEKAKELGLIDEVQHRQDLVKKLKAKHGSDLKFVRNYGGDSGPDVDFANPFAIFQLFGELMAGPSKSTKTSIAVVYVDGAIMPGSDEPSPFGGSSGAKSTTIRKALDEAADDDSIKAVVLRVDSPGGSALASEIIYDAVGRVRAAGKPVVVSMGNVAASGGYYVSCGSDHIIADPTTITASIGVVGGKMVTTGMWDCLGITWHGRQRGESADLMSSASKWDESERTKILDWMGGVYEIFKGHIVEHRGDKLTKPIDEMAGGRVFSGRQALDLGLVDQLGTFADAVEKAADLAVIGDYELRVLPKPPSIFDFLRESMGDQEDEYVSVNMNQRLFAPGSPLTETILPILGSLDPVRVRVMTQALQRFEMIHQEGVILMTPTDFAIRFK